MTTRCVTTRYVPTPQERWQNFRDERLTMSKRNRRLLFLGVVGSVFIFILCILPFLISLEGDTVAVDELADPNGQFVTLDGRELYYIHEPSDGDAVILLHGFGGSTVNWRQTLPALSDFDAYAVDLLGFGLSSKNLDDNLSYPAQADLLIEWLNLLEIESAHWVGHDMGGNIALQIAQRYPERVLSLTLTGVSWQSETAGLPDIVLNVPPLQRWARILIRWIVPAALETQLLSATEQDEVVDEEMVAAHERTFDTEAWEVAYLALARDGDQNTLPDPIDTIDIPTLLIWGAADGWVAPALGEDLEQELPNATLVLLEDVGHLPMDEAPAEFNAALLEFLAEFEGVDG